MHHRVMRASWTTGQEDCVWWVSTRHGDSSKNNKKPVQPVVRGVRRPVQLEESEQSLEDTRQRGCQREATAFRAHAVLNGVCDNLINAPQLHANQRKDGDSPVNMVVQCLSEQSRLKIMDGLGRFITVDNLESRPVVNPNFTTNFLELLQGMFLLCKGR